MYNLHPSSSLPSLQFFLLLHTHNKNKDVVNPDISHVDSINKHVGKHETPYGLNVKGGNY
jgi:hypothetical protein